MNQTKKKSFWKNLSIFIDSWSWKIWLIGAIYFAILLSNDFSKHNYFYAIIHSIVTILWLNISWRKAKIQ